MSAVYKPPSLWSPVAALKRQRRLPPGLPTSLTPPGSPLLGGLSDRSPLGRGPHDEASADPPALNSVLPKTDTLTPTSPRATAGTLSR